MVKYSSMAVEPERVSNSTASICVEATGAEWNRNKEACLERWKSQHKEKKDQYF